MTQDTLIKKEREKVQLNVEASSSALSTTDPALCFAVLRTEGEFPWHIGRLVLCWDLALKKGGSLYTCINAIFLFSFFLTLVIWYRFFNDWHRKWMFCDFQSEIIIFHVISEWLLFWNDTYDMIISPSPFYFFCFTILFSSARVVVFICRLHYPRPPPSEWLFFVLDYVFLFQSRKNFLASLRVLSKRIRYFTWAHLRPLDHHLNS